MTTTAPAPTGTRTSTARLPLDHPHGLRRVLAGALGWYARRSYGQDMEPIQVMLHHPGVTLSVARFEMSLARWKRLDHDLKELVQLAVAAEIGCSWCVDFGYYVARTQGTAREKLEQVVAWRESTLFSPVERQALAYAEAMTATPPTVTDEMVAGLREHLDDAQVVELTEMISVENLRSRTNAALGMTSQGFKDQCDLPSDLDARRRP